MNISKKYKINDSDKQQAEEKFAAEWEKPSRNLNEKKNHLQLSTQNPKPNYCDKPKFCHKKKQTNIFMQCEKQPNRACFGCWMNVTHPQQTKNHTPILETTPLFIKAEIHQLKVDFLLLVLFVSLISNNRIQCETRTKQANKNTQTNSVRE